MLNRNAINRYKSVKVKTASPGEILVLLYDGMLRFLAQAKEAMGQSDRARSGERLDRAFAILSELNGSLRPDLAPDLCQQLEALYHFCMDHIVAANIEQDPDKVDEVVRILAPLRSAWTEAVRTSRPLESVPSPIAAQPLGA